VTGRLTREEGGFTLVELLVASMVGTIVLLSAFALIDTAFRGQRTVENRLDAAANGRNAMEVVTRQLRAQVCLGKGIAPITRAEDNLVEFYASVAPPPSTPSARQTVQRRTLEYVPDGATGRGTIRQTIIDGVGSPPDVTFNGTPTVTTIARNLAPVSGVPVFRYFRYDPNTSPNVLPVAAPVTDPQVRQVIVQVQTAFESFPLNSQDASKVKTRLDNKITVRTADPTDPTRSPQCI
jgi:prepilin-type N-terminal cleavage/methylation domain-containing protein